MCDAKRVLRRQVYAEATIAFPLIVAATFAKIEKQEDRPEANTDPLSRVMQLGTPGFSLRFDTYARHG